jgi:hypothetical protein
MESVPACRWGLSESPRLGPATAKKNKTNFKKNLNSSEEVRSIISEITSMALIATSFH